MTSGSSVSAFPKQTGNGFFSLSVFITNKWNKRQQNPHNLWICSKIEKTYQPTITVSGPFNTLWASQMSHSDQNCISINILGHVGLLHRLVAAFFFRAPYISYFIYKTETVLVKRYHETSTPNWNIFTHCTVAINSDSPSKQ